MSSSAFTAQQKGVVSGTVVNFSAYDGTEFKTLCAAARLPCGLESSHCFDDGGAVNVRASSKKFTYPREVVFGAMTMVDALNKISRRHPGYKWQKIGPVLTMRPAAVSMPDLLSRKIAKVSIHKEISYRAFMQILKTADIRVVNGVDFGTAEFSATYAVIDLELKDTTVRDALNAIAAADGAVFWEFGPDDASASKACFMVSAWGTSKNRVPLYNGSLK